ncbi:hypothetical protein F4805DRAFT_447077 [Annulohypoxylon moriforme]|nr:hypothetical protein F4805DRAFT_447077 [Annulohypoxylon moriforme]
MDGSENNQQPTDSSHSPGDATNNLKHAIIQNNTATRKKIVICCDGTWNSENSKRKRSNVSEISRCITPYDRDGIPQIVFYQPGIGTGTSKLGNVWEGLTGTGLYEDICEAYSFLCHNYSHQDDEIFLIGFSRGAFTVRCVAEFLNDVGLLEKRGMVNIAEIFKLWECKTKTRALRGVGWRLNPEPAKLLEQKIKDLEETGLLRRNIKVKACAVWDTVSSLGLPMPWFIPQPPPRKLKFVNSHLCPNIQHAFQALALDEKRRHFRPIVWRIAPKDRHDTAQEITLNSPLQGGNNDDVSKISDSAAVQDHGTPQSEISVLKQCWFLGCHSDVGGGNEEAELSQISLIWMISQLNSFLSMNVENIWKSSIDTSQHYDEEVAASAEPTITWNHEIGIGVVTNADSICFFPGLDFGLLLNPKGCGIAMTWKTTVKSKNLHIRIPNSLRGFFVMGGSEVRKPCRRFWDSWGVKAVKQPKSIDSNEKIHFTARLLLADRVIRTPQSLEGAYTTIENKQMWKFPGPKVSWKEPRVPYTIDEDEPNADEMALLESRFLSIRNKLIQEYEDAKCREMRKIKKSERRWGRLRTFIASPSIGRPQNKDAKTRKNEISGEIRAKLENIAFPLVKRLESSKEKPSSGDDSQWPNTINRDEMHNSIQVVGLLAGRRWSWEVKKWSAKGRFWGLHRTPRSSA